MPGQASKWWTLGVVCAGIFMLLIDITIVNVALPDIQRELGASFTELQWVIDAYALLLAALMLNAGALADLLGRKRVFVAGLAAFTGASLACGLAQDPLALILARGAQGIGGAIMFSTSLALLTQEFHGRERGTAFGLWGATTGAAVAIGPLVGGALTTGLGWRWIFFINIPIGILTIAFTLGRVGESRDPAGSRVDWAGGAALTGALFCLVYGLLRGNDVGWGSSQIVGLLVGAVALGALFVVVELKQERPMLDLSLFRIPAFTGAQIVAFAQSASMFSLFLYLTLYLQNVLGYSPLDAGIRLLPVSLVSFVVAPAAGKLSAVAPVRLLLGLGLGLVGAGLLLMNGLDPGSDWTALLAGFVVGGAGIGLTNPPLASTAVGVVSSDRSGMASGVNNTFRQVGLATGIAALGAVFQDHVRNSVTSGLGGLGLPAAQLERVARAVSSGGAGGVLRSLPPGARRHAGEVARHAFVSGLNELFVIGAVVAFAGAVLALALIRGRDFRAAPGPARAA